MHCMCQEFDGAVRPLLNKAGAGAVLYDDRTGDEVCTDTLAL